MLTTMDGRVPAIETAAPAAALDEPMCIFAALIDGLTSPERYTVEARDGELFITPGATQPAAADASPGAGRARGLIRWKKSPTEALAMSW